MDGSVASSANGTPRSRGGYHHGFQQHSRKRRFRENDHDDRPARRHRYEEPVASRLRREIVLIAEAPVNSPAHEAANFGKRIAENFDDDQVRGPFLDTMVQLLVEQPFKIPHIAATFLYANDINGDVAMEMVARVCSRSQEAVDTGSWREFKLLLRFLACLQGTFEGDGVFQLLDDLFSRAADQQTASQEDTIGLELVKIILMTLPYALAACPTGLEKAQVLLDKTGIIAMIQHPLEDLADPYPIDNPDRPFGYLSALELLQKQLVAEAKNGWKLSCIPRLYKRPEAEADQVMDNAADTSGQSRSKHVFPTPNIPSPVNPGSRPLFPETYFSIYADQEIESVPRTHDIAASLIRDAIVDTINVMDFNRIAAAKYLIEIDHFFAPGTFLKRATPFDRIREAAGGTSSWKPEDMIVDAVFSQMLLLPAAEHKLVYYNSVITEACKVAPAAIAPTLGRAIRFLFRHIDSMDLEPSYRVLDWFAHHLSNFDFRWKWTEWSDSVDHSPLDTKKAFIVAAIDKEIRLSFTKRIRETLPKEYHKLIAEGKFKDTPDFKYTSDSTPFAAEGRQILNLIRKRAPEAEIQPIIESIHSQAANQGSMDPLIQSTDAYVTAVCFVGSKSLSHVLSCIERCKERLLGIGRESEAARRQIVGSVVAYWTDLPGVAVNIVDKLLNYTIVTPEAVIRWCLGEGIATAEDAATGTRISGAGLADSWRYELVAATMGKVTNRVRQIVAARLQAATMRDMPLPEEQLAALDGTLSTERDGMRALFTLVDQLLGQRAASGSSEDEQLVARWAERWARTFRRMGRREECVVGEDAVKAAVVVGSREAERKMARDEIREAQREEERKRVAEEERVKAELEEKKQAEREQRWKMEQEEKKAEEERAKAAREEQQAVAAASEAENGVAELDVAEDDADVL